MTFLILRGPVRSRPRPRIDLCQAAGDRGGRLDRDQNIVGEAGSWVPGTSSPLARKQAEKTLPKLKLDETER